MTNMDIVMVVITGELPKSCHKCRLAYRLEQERGMERYCPFDDQNVDLYTTSRFQGCPLVLDDTTSTRESDTTDEEGEE